VLDPDTIPVPGCGGEDTQVNWSVDYGYEHPQCTNTTIAGTEPVFTCDATPGDTCDDGNPCTSGDSFSENCICAGEGPTAMLDTPLPAASCSEVDVTVTITVDMIPGPEGLGVGITDFTGYNFRAYTLLSPGDPLTFDLDINIPRIFSCTPQDLALFLRLSCPEGSGIIGTLEPIGTVTIYPDPSLFTVEIEPAVECGVAPVIIAPQCGDLVLNETPPDLPACPAGANGFVEYTFGPGFDVGTSPICFNESLLNGQEPFTACSNCCPLVADVTIADTGPFCSGDMTEVCVTFDTVFETDGQVTINGIDAVAEEDQICFQLDLTNNGCYNEAQIPFEIVCNDEGLVINGFTPDVLVAPNPANFQFDIFPGDCTTLSYYAPTSNANCYLVSGNPVFITEPIDGCPPIDGEVQVDLIYLNGNFAPVDVSTFGCDNFPLSAILPQPGCSTCDPTTCSISADISEIVCDDNGTPQDGTDDIVTITVTITSTDPWAAGDGTTGNNGDTYTFPSTLADNAISMMFSVDNETNCEIVFTMVVGNCDEPSIPTLSQWGLIILCLLMMCFGAVRMSNTVASTGILIRAITK